MQYGHFDLENKEYIITSPNTPVPWVNYLGSPEYGAVISNNAAGYSFEKSGAEGRITRFRFNSMMALPGRYIYIRDSADGDYWSASWQPVGKPLDCYKSECVHGTAYTVIKSEYKDIKSETTYYVPLGKTYEVWHCVITNTGSSVRNLSLFGFAEFTNEPNYEQDGVNLQYSQFISRTQRIGNTVLQTVRERKGKQERFLGVTGAEVSGHCGDLSAFIGEYRTYSNPVCVENGKCTGQDNYCLNSCAALQSDAVLGVGESVTLTYVLGNKSAQQAKEILAGYENADTVGEELAQLKEYWHSKLDSFKVTTPSAEFNNMVSVWNAYQCLVTFTWSRAASLIYCGLRNGYGYRDTVQDIQGIIHIAPELAREKLLFMLSAQVTGGAGLPLVKFTHNAGHEDTPDDDSYVKATGHPSYRADDALWLFPTVEKYIGETGDTAFLDEVVPYANAQEDTVYEHLKRAIEFSAKNLGIHGLPAGLHADWNDCLRLGKDGETVFVAFQLFMALGILRDYAAEKDDSDYAGYCEKFRIKLSEALEKAWNGQWFVRGFINSGADKGKVIGNKGDAEAEIWLNPQSWSVISGFARDERGRQAMAAADKALNTPYGLKLFDPPYDKCFFEGALMPVFNLDVKENGGIFSQPQGWAILSSALLGDGNKAFEYFMETSPAAMNAKAEIRVIEPYAHGQFTESRRSPYEGRSHVHWLTGTASTVMVGCVEGICGMRPVSEGLVIDPSIPAEWDGFKIEKTFRGRKLYITVENPNHSQSGVKEMYLNGKLITGNLIPEADLTDVNDIKVILI